MAEPSVSSRALRWLAPSAVAASAGALAAGALEGVNAIGFVTLLVVVPLMLAAVLARGVLAAWDPARLAPQLTEDGGGMPRLAGWLATIWLGAAVLSWALFTGTWQLSAATAFKPLAVSFAQPVIAVGALLVVVAASVPAVRLFAAIARRLDARWRRSGRRTLLTPRILFGGATLTGLATAYAIWRLAVTPRLGELDTSLVQGPFVAAAVAVVLHALWPRLGRARATVAFAIAAVAIVAIGFAMISTRARPSQALGLWGQRGLATLALDTLFDVHAIRSRVSPHGVTPVARPGAPHPDVVLVTIDTMRADHTPPYGGPADMPVLRELAQRGAVFEWAFAPSNVTRRSLASIATGTASSRVRGTLVGGAIRLDPRHVVLPERMRAAGYDTAGFVCCRGFWEQTGLERGFEHLVVDPSGLALARAANAWLAGRVQQPNRRPLFVWMHVIEPHDWTTANPGPPMDARDRRRYLKALEDADAVVRELLRGFANVPTARAPIVIVTSDHGEGLGDHGQPFHGSDLYNSQVRVPLVVAGPGIAVQRIRETVSGVDLVPTVLELAGYAAPVGPSIDGRSLADLATGRRSSTDGGLAFGAMVKDRANPTSGAMLVQGSWKLIVGPGTQELYDLSQDPDEKSNQVSMRPDLAERMKRILHAKQTGPAPF